MKYILLLFISYSVFAVESEQNIQKQINKSKKQEEVIENPTLKTLSGSLNKMSLYSSFTYSAGSLSEPLGAERPNIREASETASLASMSGNLGVKYRLSKSDNFSFQMGLYATTPFHSTIDTDNAKNQNDFDNNKQRWDADDYVLSYFKTYYLGDIQNVSFLRYQYITRGIYRDYGYRYAMTFSHAAACKLNKASYIAASLTYDNYQYDATSTDYNGRRLSLIPYQVTDSLRSNLTAEFYLKRNMSLRLITEVFSYSRARREAEIETRNLQQTIGFTYFYSRDISIAPNIRFIADDLRSDRTNLGLNMNVNI